MSAWATSRSAGASPAAALLGALTAQAGYGTPSIGGKDSMSGSFNELDVPPTLVSFAVGMSKASHTGTALLAAPGQQSVSAANSGK